MLKATTNHYTKEEELELGRKVQAGNAAEKKIKENDYVPSEYKSLIKIRAQGKIAQEKLFNVEVGLANKLSTRLYKNAGIRYSLDDIAQDAYVALTEATNIYDPSKNCRFSTYAYYRIFKMISVRLNRMRPIRLPENRMGQYLNITRAEKKYLRTHANPDEEEMEDFVLKETGFEKKVYLSIKQSLQPVTSTSAPIGETGKFEDLLEDKNAISSIGINNPELLYLMSKLTQSEQEAISLAYSIGNAGITYNDYLKKNNLTEKDMNKKVRRIIRKMRKYVKDNQNEEAS